MTLTTATDQGRSFLGALFALPVALAIVAVAYNAANILV